MGALQPLDQPQAKHGCQAVHILGNTYGDNHLYRCAYGFQCMEHRLCDPDLLIASYHNPYDTDDGWKEKLSPILFLYDNIGSDMPFKPAAVRILPGKDKMAEHAAPPLRGDLLFKPCDNKEKGYEEGIRKKIQALIA